MGIGKDLCKTFAFVIIVTRRGVEQLVARKAHNLEVVGSNPTPATILLILTSENNIDTIIL